MTAMLLVSGFLSGIRLTAMSLIYGVICLILNAAYLLDGPYFFLKIHEQSAWTIALWFAIIAVLCGGLAALYYKVKWRHRSV